MTRADAASAGRVQCVTVASLPAETIWLWLWMFVVVGEHVHI